MVVGIFLALGKWLGTVREDLGLATPAPHALPTEWALVSEVVILAVMVAADARRGRLWSMLRPYESLIWFGGVMIVTGGFFQYAYGPWGVGLSHYGVITWNLSASGLPTALVAWPMAFGAVIVAAAYVTAVSGRPSAYRWRWAIVGLFLTAIATTRFALVYQAGVGLNRTTRTVSLGSMGLVLAAIAVALIFARGDRRKAHLIDLTAALWLLLALDPRGSVNGHAIPLGDALRGVGPGYWLQALGTLSLLMGAIGPLFSAGGPGRPHLEPRSDGRSTGRAERPGVE
jgi:hypothetical protein